MSNADIHCSVNKSYRLVFDLLTELHERRKSSGHFYHLDHASKSNAPDRDRDRDYAADTTAVQELDLSLRKVREVQVHRVIYARILLSYHTSSPNPLVMFYCLDCIEESSMDTNTVQRSQRFKESSLTRVQR